MYRPNIPGHLHVFGPNLQQFFSTQKMHVSEYACKNGVRKNAPQKIAHWKITPRKQAPQENCLPENCFTRFLLFLTLSYTSSFSNFL